MSFQLILPQTRSGYGSAIPLVRISATNFNFNGAAFREYVKSNVYVTTYNDALTRRIGFKFHRERVPGSRKLSVTNSNRTVSNSTVIKGILKNVTEKKFELVFDEKTNLVTFKY